MSQPRKSAPYRCPHCKQPLSNLEEDPLNAAYLESVQDQKPVVRHEGNYARQGVQIGLNRPMSEGMQTFSKAGFMMGGIVVGTAWPLLRMKPFLTARYPARLPLLTPLAATSAVSLSMALGTAGWMLGPQVARVYFTYFNVLSESLAGAFDDLIHHFTGLKPADPVTIIRPGDHQFSQIRPRCPNCKRDLVQVDPTQDILHPAFREIVMGKRAERLTDEELKSYRKAFSPWLRDSQFFVGSTIGASICGYFMFRALFKPLMVRFPGRLGLRMLVAAPFMAFASASGAAVGSAVFPVLYEGVDHVKNRIFPLRIPNWKSGISKYKSY